MKPSSKSACERYHDRVAPIYDDMYQDPYWDFYHTITWFNLKKHLPRTMAAPILDIGGGTGYWACRLAKSGYRVILGDISRKMLEVARKKADRAGLTDRIDFCKLDICDLKSLEPDSFDLVIAQGDPLSCCRHPSRAVKQVNRVLKKDGRFIASVDNKFSGLRVFIGQNKINDLEKLVATGRTNWFTKDRSEQFPLTYFTPDELRKLFRRNGFEVISLIGKPVLPIKNSQLLKDRESFNRLLKMERQLQSEESLLGLAGHLEIVGKKK